MYIERVVVAVTTGADGSATAYSTFVSGRIFHVIYEKDDFADGVDVTITLENTGQVILSQTDLNASATFSPRVPTQDIAGTASLYAGSGEPVEDYLVAGMDRIKIAIAQGGNAKSGTFKFIVG